MASATCDTPAECNAWRTCHVGGTSFVQVSKGMRTRDDSITGLTSGRLQECGWLDDLR
jgi:hypothetical protein